MAADKLTFLGNQRVKLFFHIYSLRRPLLFMSLSFSPSLYFLRQLYIMQNLQNMPSWNDHALHCRLTVKEKGRQPYVEDELSLFFREAILPALEWLGVPSWCLLDQWLPLKYSKSNQITQLTNALSAQMDRRNIPFSHTLLEFLFD